METKKERSHGQGAHSAADSAQASGMRREPATGMDALLVLVDRWMAEPDIDDEAADNLEAALNENRRRAGDHRLLFPE